MVESSSGRGSGKVLGGVLGKQRRQEAGKHLNSFLRKPEYMTARGDDHSHSTKKQELDSKEDIARKIEAQFEACREEPKHPTNPSLKPIEVRPVFPDWDLWQNSLVQFTFDSDPLSNHVKDIETNTEKKVIESQLMEHAAVKAYKVTMRDTEDKSSDLLALLVPHSLDNIDETEQEYDWVREYSYNLSQQNKSDDAAPSYVFIQREDYVGVCVLDSKLSLHPAKQTKKIKNLSRPAKITMVKK